MAISSNLTPLQTSLLNLNIDRVDTSVFSFTDKKYQVIFNDDFSCKRIEKLHGATPISVKEFKLSSDSPTEKSLKKALKSKPLLAQYDEKLHKECERSRGTPEYQSLCLSGGGAKGISFLGVFQALGSERLNHIHEVSGASAGSLICVCLAIGMNEAQITESCLATEIEFDQKSIRTEIEKVIVHHLGIYAKEISFFLKKHGEFLKDQAGTDIVPQHIKPEDIKSLTFKQLELIRYRKSFFVLSSMRHFYLKRLVLVATSKGKEVELSADNTPDMSIALAAVASSAVPMLVKPVKVLPKFFKKESLIYDEVLELSDGGVTNNIPFCYLTSNKILAVAFDFQEMLLKADSIASGLKDSIIKVAVNVTSQALDIVKRNKYDITQARDNSRVTLFISDTDVNFEDLKIATKPKNLYPIKWSTAEKFKAFDSQRTVTTKRIRYFEAHNVGSYLQDKYDDEKRKVNVKESKYDDYVVLSFNS